MFLIISLVVFVVYVIGCLIASMIVDDETPSVVGLRYWLYTLGSWATVFARA